MRLHRKSSRRGMVLIVVTILLLLISLGTIGLVSLVQTEYRAARLRGSELELENAAAAGRAYLGALAAQSRSAQTAIGGLSGNRELFQNQSLLTDSNSPDEIRFTLTPPGIAGGAEASQLGPSNESAKLHLGQLLAWEKE